jgi:hypothetical protein
MSGLGIVHRRGGRPARIFLADDPVQLAPMAAPAAPVYCSPTSLPMLHMTMDGWLRSRRSIARKSCSCQSGKIRWKSSGVFLRSQEVEHLVHDQEAHAVGQLKQLRIGRIVAHAHGIRAHLAQHLQLALGRAHC